MNQRTLLKKTIALARTGDAEAYENFYILTVKDTYGKICALVREEDQADEILVEIYTSLYHGVHTLPSDEGELLELIEEEIYRAAERILNEEPARVEFDGKYETLKEEKAATMWLRIEERAGLNREEPEEEKNSFLSYLYSVVKICLTIAVLLATAFVLYRGWQWFYGGKNNQIEIAEEQDVPESSTSEMIVIDQERKESGWEQKPDGKLYYVTKEGVYADGQVPIGKQMLTFSQNGELTMIGSNRAVSENMNLSFDETTKYEVRDGDIYKTESDSGEEQRIVMNGHVVQADVRCGALWYISQYQVPNSDQIKTTIYRTGLDGEKEEEIYTSASTLETEAFQVTSKWLYYLSDGMLLRKNLADRTVEYLAGDVEYYFAWEDTAYYMKDRTLERVSKGSDYDGIEAGYRIEKRERGFVLLDALGNEIQADSSGEIQNGDRIYRLEDGVIRSVRPDVRKDGAVTYYIDDAGTDRKIYWTDDSGARGLVRQEGLAADSLCIAGGWLYYSARTAQYGAECESRIYRVNLQTMELETVGKPFRGYMRNLYYFDNVQRIYGEYIPSVADPETIHGEIAAILPGQTMGTINDTVVRPESDGSDMLEMVMADGNQIYCLYHRCIYDSDSGHIVWETTEPLIIDLSGTGN